MSVLLETGLEALAFTRGVTNRILEGFDESNAMTRCGPSGSHVMYIAGHIAGTDEAFMTHVGGLEPVLEPSWFELFGMNVEVSDDASAYPSFEKVRQVLASRREALEKWFSGMDDAALQKPLPEPWNGFAKTHAILMSTLAFHEGFHIGQISAARRVTGLPRAIG